MARSKLEHVRKGYFDDPAYEATLRSTDSGLDNDGLGVFRDGELRAPDFKGFERALTERDRVSAWLKFKDLCFSDERIRLNAEHVRQIMMLLADHRPPKLMLMENSMGYAKQLSLPIDIGHYNLLIKAACKSSDFKSARRYLTEAMASKLKPDLSTYNHFLSLYAYERNPEGAIAFFAKMKEEGITPDTESYNAIIAAGVKSRKPKLVEEYKAKLESSGNKPDQSTYELLIQGCVSRGEIDAAHAAYQEMLSRGIPANAKVLTTYFSALAESGLAEKIGPILRDAQTAGLEMDVPLYTAVIQGYFKAKDTRSAVRTFEDMVAKGCRPDITAFHSLVQGFCEMGMPIQAEEVMVFMRSGAGVESIPDSIVRAVMSGYIKARMVSDAVRIFDQIRLSGPAPTTFTYNTLLKGLSDDFDIEVMTDYWNQWKKDVAASASSGEATPSKGKKKNQNASQEVPTPDLNSFNIVLEAYIKCSRTDRAQELIREMVDLGFNPDAANFVNLVEAHLRSRDYSLAAEAIVLMRRSALGSTSKKSASIVNVIRSHAPQFEALIQKLQETSESIDSTQPGGAVSPRKGIPKSLKELAESGIDLRAATEAASKRQIAVELYRELAAADVRLSEDTYRAVMKAYHASADLVAVVKTWTTFRNFTAPATPETESPPAPVQPQETSANKKTDTEASGSAQTQSPASSPSASAAVQNQSPTSTPSTAAPAPSSSPSPENPQSPASFSTATAATPPVSPSPQTPTPAAPPNHQATPLATVASVHPSTVTTLLAAVRDLGKAQTSRAVIELVKNEKLPLDLEGYVYLGCIMGKVGMSNELIRLVLDMVEAGHELAPVFAREWRANLKRSGDRGAEMKVTEFLEENWPEVFALEEGDAN
ncbi:hypothetical protein HDU96_009290 [Phlyctochytrium bullatum]|nr:hypothetical protein HDU96_009290 [Phlyctochytrium bullatum]